MSDILFMLIKNRVVLKSLSVKKYTSSSHILMNPRATQKYVLYSYLFQSANLVQRWPPEV